jgi:regulator of protease activity HflC (stomatin/prohibitin superfamily)
MGYLLIATAIVIATLVFSILSPSEGKPFVGFIGLLAFVCFTAFNMVYQVPAGHVGLVYRFGAIVGPDRPRAAVRLPLDLRVGRHRAGAGPISSRSSNRSARRRRRCMSLQL